jgi:hypothetical protein
MKNAGIRDIPAQFGQAGRTKKVCHGGMAYGNGGLPTLQAIGQPMACKIYTSFAVLCQ